MEAGTSAAKLYSRIESACWVPVSGTEAVRDTTPSECHADIVGVGRWFVRHAQDPHADRTRSPGGGASLKQPAAPTHSNKNNSGAVARDDRQLRWAAGLDDLGATWHLPCDRWSGTCHSSPSRIAPQRRHGFPAIRNVLHGRRYEERLASNELLWHEQNTDSPALCQHLGRGSGIGSVFTRCDWRL